MSTSTTTSNWPALHQAAYKGDDKEVRRLLEEGADLNSIDDEGETALHQAAWRGNDIVTSMLLKTAFPFDAQDDTGQTSLHHAASTGSSRVVQLLLDKGADPTIKDNDGRKPHSIAEENFHHTTATILREEESRVYGYEVPPDTENIPVTSIPDMQLDPAVLAAINADSTTASIEPYGQASSTIPSKIIVNIDSKTKTYFMKTGPDAAMFEGEYESLKAVRTAVPSLCPRPIAHGKLANSNNSFLLTDFIDIESTTDEPSSNLSLAQKLAQLHNTPLPNPPGFDQPAFGFHLPTCVGRTLQSNTWHTSWAAFFTENRLRPVDRIIEEKYGTDVDFHGLLNRIIDEVVPYLLASNHIKPSLVHGDLWAGNFTRGIVGGEGGREDVVFDPRSCHAHS
ncbi:MAG: hypothetical protein Q9224_007084, partial [Gallowayella concinna]